MFPTVQFHIPTQWRVTGQIADVARLLSTPQDFPRWWGDVYLSVQVTHPGADRNIGKTVAVQSKGWLPYRMTWQGTLLESEMPTRWVVAASGDLVGRGEWRLRQVGDKVEVIYDWQVTSDRLLFRLLAPLFRRLMVSNHRWAMDKGRTGLQVELDRLVTRPRRPTPSNP